MSHMPLPAHHRRIRTTDSGSLDRTHTRSCHRVEVRDGTGIALTQWRGSTYRHTVVFLHGLCLSQHAWKDQIEHVLDRFGTDVQVLAPDHRGHGGSDAADPDTYTIDQLATDLDDLLATLRVKGPVTLVGHSLGGMVSLAYLARPGHLRSVDVRGLVLCATAAANVAGQGIGRLLTTPGLDQLVAAATHLPSAAAAAVAAPLRFVADQLRDHGLTSSRELMGVASHALATTSLATALGYLPSLRSYDCSAVLGTITAAVTILSGGRDALTPPAHAELMASMIPGAIHQHFPASGHMLPQLESRAVSSAIADTIASVRPPRRSALAVGR